MKILDQAFKFLNPTFQIQNQSVTDHPILSEPQDTSGFEFSPSQKRVFYQSQDLGLWIRENAKKNPQWISEVAKELEKFKKKKEKEYYALLQEAPDEVGLEASLDCLSLCDAHLARLYEIMQNQYAHLSTGIEVEYDEKGDLWLNGINVQETLAHYRLTRHPKTRVYLCGLKQRLFYALGQTHRNRIYARLQDTLALLMLEIDQELTLS